MEERHRVSWIDVAKGIGIFLMVMGHTGMPKLGNQWIYSFHMPLFFFISGMLFDPDKYSMAEFLRRKMNTMICPYLFFVALDWVGRMLLQYDRLPSFSLSEALVYGVSSAIWFIYVLFFVELAAWVFYRIESRYDWRYIVMILSLVMIVASYMAYQYSVHLPYKMEVVGFGLLFFIIGKNSMQIKYSVGSLWLVIIGLCHVFGAYFVMPRLDMASNEWGGITPLNLILALVGIYLTISVSIQLSQRKNMIVKFFKFFGENTIVVVGLSHIILMTFKKYFDSWGVPNMIGSPIRHVLLWIALLGAVCFLNRFAPRLIGKKKPKSLRFD